MSLLEHLRMRIKRINAPRYHTMFGTARVYETMWDGSHMRMLDLKGTLQSATYLDERWCDPPFAYLRGYDCMYEAGVPVRDVCMLGGGGYAYPKHVVAHHPYTRIDVVEIDPAITRIAREHFFLDRVQEEFHTDKTGRLGLVCDDAVAYLQACARKGRRYDAILNDCFAAGEAAYELLDAQAISLVHECLTEQGLYLTNVITALEGQEAGPLTDLVLLLGAEFSRVYALPMAELDADEAGNVMVVATNARVRIPHAIQLVEAW